MKKTIQILITISFLTFSSCSSDDDNYSLPIAGNECRIAETTFSNDSKYVHYYDEFNRLVLREKYIEDLHTEDWKYIYNGNTVNANRYSLIEDGTLALDENSSYSVFLNSNGFVQRREGRSEHQYQSTSDPTQTYTVIMNHIYEYNNEGYLTNDIETYKRYDTESGDYLSETEVVRKRNIENGNIQTLTVSLIHDQNLSKEVKTEYSYTNDSGNLYSGELFFGTPNSNLVKEAKIYTDGNFSFYRTFTYQLDENSNVTKIMSESVISDINTLFTTFHNWGCN